MGKKIVGLDHLDYKVVSSYIDPTEGKIECGVAYIECPRYIILRPLFSVYCISDCQPHSPQLKKYNLKCIYLSI